MSVALELSEKFKTMGTLIVRSDSDTMSGFDYVQHIRAIISFVKAVDMELINKDDLYFMMCILEDYMPNEKQADKMLQP